jgi:hypothetical protein
MVGLRMYRKFFFGLLILAFSTRWATAAETFGTTVLTSGSRIEVPTTILPGRASAEQMTLYREKIERIRRHHLSLPTPIAFRQFSATLSANKQVVKPKLEASLSDGLDVTNRVAATTLAKMDYSYVSPVAEPSVAMVRENILVTFNWGAIWSGDSGKSFTQLDPFSLFTNPRPAVGNGFCCDQIAIYSEKYDLLVWLLQGSDDGSANTIRLLLAKGNDIAARRFQVRDFSPESVGSWSGNGSTFPTWPCPTITYSSHSIPLRAVGVADMRVRALCDFPWQTWLLIAMLAFRISPAIAMRTFHLVLLKALVPVCSGPPIAIPVL